ncbi:MAG TPA: sigma-70 family RNA polymerase sigma factor [Acidimicrobiia bacterium]|nr:sigma-70 family RNA polymerase sigma factor [Acidimicrobiia bacterium]
MTGHPGVARLSSAQMMGLLITASEMTADLPAGWADRRVELLVERLYREEGANLVRLARFFVDDRNAAEDLVQEAFIRLARSVGRIKDETRVTSYLRSIVLNLARDHNRRGLVSLRHQPASDPAPPSVEEEISLREDQRRVIDALRDLPKRQRDCLVLRYYLELGVGEIAGDLGLSVNSVKTHLKRGLRSLEARLERGDDDNA